MTYCLADRLGYRESDVIQRFDPRFWTIDFPRPMMAAATTLGPDSLRVDALFYNREDLAGLIWESEDRWSHPLLAYQTQRDYRQATLSFRWRSSGLKPLDAIHGPTLTIEGRDAAGDPRSWYVRLWNYATGTPEDAQIALPFSTLEGGFLLPGEADPVFAGDIDRMFISLVSPDFDATSGRLSTPQEAWVELSKIRCDGGNSSLVIGDVLVPEHRLNMATGYDDAYNQTPERLLRQIEALGYGKSINHYVGMSHYFRLIDESGELIVDPAAAALNTPCEKWHRDFAERAAQLGFELIFSLSYELFDEHCPESWKQRFENGDPALTGWVPPSTLLSPAKTEAMSYLQAIGAAFAKILQDAALPVRFQIGEPWWWVTTDGRACLYDAATTAELSGLSVSIPDLREPLDAGQLAMLDAAGAMLAQSTLDLRDAVRAHVSPDEAEILLLVYLPTVLDEAMPEARRFNMPPGWQRPAFDILQLEDYDWVIAGRHAATRKAVDAVFDRLAYPETEQHYFSGFILTSEEVAGWREIERAANDAVDRGTSATFIWALPQVMRDGFTHFDLTTEEEPEMEAFHDVDFPLAIGLGASVTPEFSTAVVTTLSGHERRNSDWADARLRFDAGPGIRSEDDLKQLIGFFRARRGAAVAFRFRDPFDHSSAGMTDTPGPLDQATGIGDGEKTVFQLVKNYGEQVRHITHPVAGSVTVAIDGVTTTDWQLDEGGTILFDSPPDEGSAITAGYLFDVPVRFAEDRLNVSLESFAAAGAESVPLLEVKGS